MTDLPVALLKKKPAFSFVWLVPAACLAAVALFAYRNARDRGPLIEIHFTDAENLAPGKTPIKYLGATVGHVTALSIDYEKKDVTATARLDRSAAALAREGTTFVIVKPDVSFRGIQGLTTIFSGSWLTLRPGKGDLSREFKGYSDEQSLAHDQGGLVVNLTTPHAGFIQVGDPVLFRGLRVGAIAETEISSTGQSVLIRAKIDYRYDQFVRTNSKFWEASGVHAKIGLFGANVSVESLQSLLKGGVAFATPDNPGPQAKSGDAFALLPKPEPDWEKWAPKL